MSRVRLPTALRAEAGGAREVEIDGHSVGDVLSALVNTFPGLADRVLHDEAVPQFLNVYVDGADIATLAGLDTVVGASSTIILLPAMAGGQLGWGTMRM